jgi:hypothetical protein
LFLCKLFIQIDKTGFECNTVRARLLKLLMRLFSHFHANCFMETLRTHLDANMEETLVGEALKVI